MEASEWTRSKLTKFAGFMGRYPLIMAAIQCKWKPVPSFYWDMTPGPGLIYDGPDRIEGSPLIALEAFKRQSLLKVNCLFTEYEPDYAAQLTQIMAEKYSAWTDAERQRIKYSVQCIDHREILYGLRHEQMNNCSGYGLLYWDGLGENVYPADGFNPWLNRHSYHDLLLMASGTAPKRAGRERLDILLKTPRKRLAISYPVGDWEWIFGLGTNWTELPAKLSKKHELEFHSSDSKMGKHIIDLVSTTKAEREQRDQGRLW